MLAHALADAGVTTMFGVIGDGNLFMVDSFVRDTGGVFVSFSHEAGAIAAANAFASRSGEVGVATVTHGPGFTNSVTPLVDGARGRNSTLLIAGDTSRQKPQSLQSIDQRAVALSTGVTFQSVVHAHTVQKSLRDAMARTHIERQPVVLNIPVDIQWDQSSFAQQGKLSPPLPLVGNADDLDAPLGLLASARRPLVILGRGAASSPAREAVLAFAQRIGAPLATTLKAKDLFHDVPQTVGIVGSLSNEHTMSVVLASDCIVAFGASLNSYTTVEGSILSGRSSIQIDSDPLALGRYYRTTSSVLGDATWAAKEFVKALDIAEISPTRFADSIQPLVKTRVSPPSVGGDADVESIQIGEALELINRKFAFARTLVLDGGRFVFESWKRLRVSDPMNYVHTVNFGSIGLGMGAAIGAAYADTSTPTLLVCGDGGFMLGGLAELNTAVRHKVDLTVVVLNDGSYGAEHVQFRARGLPTELSTFDWPDFAPVAKALGAHGRTVRTLHDLEQALEESVTVTGPKLIDIKLDPDQIRGPNG